MTDPAYFVRYEDIAGTTRVEAHNVGPEHRFSVQWLERESRQCRLHGLPYLEWDGQRIVLNLSNGRWVYAVVARENDGLTVVGRWPD